MTLVAPFPYFGGKRRVASLIWERFGDVANYGNQGDGRGRENAERERLWFSPACLSVTPQQGVLL